MEGVNYEIHDVVLVLLQGMQGRAWIVEAHVHIAGQMDGVPDEGFEGRVPVAAYADAGKNRAKAKAPGDRPANLLNGQGIVRVDNAGSAGGNDCCWGVRKVHGSAVLLEGWRLLE